MNIQHLKYALEVEKTASISKAAENLYMNQPHLSKAIRELEESIGISVFNRTSKGVFPTKKGAEFLLHPHRFAGDRVGHGRQALVGVRLGLGGGCGGRFRWDGCHGGRGRGGPGGRFLIF